MRFTIVFPDPDTLRLAHQLSESDRHRVIAVAGLGATSPAISQVAWRTVSLEQVLTLPDMDALIVGRSVVNSGVDEEIRLGFIRTCVQAELPLLISHPIGDLNTAYELQVAQSNSGLVILPFVLGLWHPCWRQAREALDQHDGKQPAVRTVAMLRELSSLSQQQIQWNFAVDALLLRLLLGPMQRIHCFRQEHPMDESLTAVNVQMSDQAGRLVRWTAAGGNSGRAEMRFEGDIPLTLDLRGDPADWTLAIGSEHPQRTVSNRHPELELLDFFADSVRSAGNEALAAWPFSPSARPHDLLMHACRALELGDAIERSARRERTIELSAEEQSESSTFKSFMSAGGCLVLAATVTLGLFLIAVDLFQDRTGLFAVTGQWPWLIILLVLGFFLALQLLKVFIPDQRSAGAEDRTAD